MKSDSRKKSVVVVGGGTGTHMVLSGLKRHAEEIDLTAIIAMTDSGGSSGRLREEFGHLPLGDVRRALVALADEKDPAMHLARQLFEHRFLSDGDMSGHNFGNIFLIALTDIFGSEEAAVAAASRILRTCGEVLPVTNDLVDLVATYEDGTVVIGEHEIDEPNERLRTKKIVSVGTTGTAELTVAAEVALLEADCIIFGPGDLYTSILANCLIEGFCETLAHSSGTVVYIQNLMTKAGQTTDMDLGAHVEEFARYSKRMPDVVLANTTPLPEDVLKKHTLRYEYPVALTHAGLPTDIIADDFLAPREVVRKRGDVLTRSLMHHDTLKLAAALMDIVRAKETAPYTPPA